MAAAAGAFAQGLHSRNIPNTALLLIERAINRDIAAQKADFAKLGKQAKMKQNILARLVTANQDELRSEAEAQIVGRDIAMMGLDKLAAETKSLQAKQAITYVRKQLELQNAEKLHKTAVQVGSNEVDTLLRVMEIQNRGRSRAGDAPSIDPVELSRKFAMFENVIKGLDIGKGVFNLADATKGRITDTLNEYIGPGTASAYAGTDPNAELLYRDYQSYGLLVITELAKSYQGKHLSDRDMKSYMAVLPDIKMITSEDMRKVALQRIRNIQEFYLRPDFAEGSAQERSDLIYAYALKHGDKRPAFYTNPDAKFENEHKQKRLETYRAEKAARDRQ